MERKPAVEDVLLRKHTDAQRKLLGKRTAKLRKELKECQSAPQINPASRSLTKKAKQSAPQAQRACKVAATLKHQTPAESASSPRLHVLVKLSSCRARLNAVPPVEEPATFIKHTPAFETSTGMPYQQIQELLQRQSPTALASLSTEKPLDAQSTVVFKGENSSVTSINQWAYLPLSPTGKAVGCPSGFDSAAFRARAKKLVNYEAFASRN